MDLILGLEVGTSSSNWYQPHPIRDSRGSKPIGWITIPPPKPIRTAGRTWVVRPALFRLVRIVFCFSFR